MRFKMLIGACAIALASAGCAQSDAGITTAVKGKLVADDLVKARQINVDTKDKVVTLTGQVQTQAEDGSWHVKSRAPKFQPYFDTIFPYGHDQWISAMATGWAATAVAMALP